LSTVEAETIQNVHRWPSPSVDFFFVVRKTVSQF